MSGIVLTVLLVISMLLQAYSGIMFLQAIMSWFVSPMNRLYIFLRRITEPFVSIFRPLAMRLTSRMGLPIDLAFMFAVIALQIIAGFIQWIIRNMSMLGMI